MKFIIPGELGLSVKKRYNDLMVVLALTLISYICLLVQALELYTLPSLINYIPYTFLLLFLPGYALLSAENPLFIQKSILNRVGLAIAVSLILSILIALLLTYTPLKVASNIIFYIIIAFTITLTLTAAIRRRKNHTVRFIDSEDEKPTPGYNHIKKEPKNVELEIERIESTSPEEKNDFQAKLSAMKNRSPRGEEKEKEIASAGMAIKKKEIKVGKGESESDLPRPQLKPQKQVETASTQDTTVKPGAVLNKDIPDKPVNKPIPDKPLPDKTRSNNTKKSVPDKPRKSAPTPSPSRRPFLYYDLLLVFLTTVISLAFLLVPGLNNTIWTSLLGLFLMFFLPGYALIAVIYPKIGDLHGGKRLIFSFGVSYLLTALIGLILNYIPLGNTLNTLGSHLNIILLGLSILTLIFISAAYLARRRVPRDNCFQLDLRGACRNIKGGLTGETRNRNLFSVAVFIVIMLMVSLPAYEIMKPSEQTVQSYSEFYVLGPDGNNITEYPNNLTSGENGMVTMVLVNHENQETSYQITTTSNQTVMDEINVILQPNEKKEIPYNFTAGEPAVKKLEFLLYKLPDVNVVYLSQSFMVNIVPAVTETLVEDIATDSTDSSDTAYTTDEVNQTGVY